MNEEERLIISKTEEMIDEIKTICSNFGLGNASSEYKIITEVFLYKFLNDKFLYEVKQVDERLAKLEKPKDVEIALNKMKDEYEFLLLRLKPDTAKLKVEHLISYLFSHKNDDDFYKLFDDTLVDIANFNLDIFSVKTGGKEKIRLFDPLSPYITETNKKSKFCRAIIDKLVEFSFEGLFKQKYDAFAIIFEHLIKDYNKDFGKYAEYYTPNSIARIIARILVKDDEKVENVTVYDPAAGSGTLVLALAHQIGEDNCTIYTQDISQKSNEFLRLNLILNNLVHSLGNVVHGNTLTEPAHYNENKTRLAQFDYIVSNPPFKTDFSDDRDTLASDKFKDRFFAGVPKIPNKDKDKMPIYLMFIQHIIYSLSKNGKAAIVVPTGFLTAQARIEKTVREKLVADKMLRGVVSMPSNIFATTGTNVSVLFIDKANKDEKVLLVDASKLGEKVKDGKNQRTVLRTEEVEKIVNTFANKEIIDDFSVEVTYDQLKENHCSFSAGQYFKVKIEYVELTQEEFKNKIKKLSSNLDKYFSESKTLESEIKQRLEELKYE